MSAADWLNFEPDDRSPIDDRRFTCGLFERTFVPLSRVSFHRLTWIDPAIILVALTLRTRGIARSTFI